MSDPVTNVDIEDVLASIRRLVLQSPPEGRPPEPSPPVARGRLVLTQALRVEEPVDEPDTPVEPGRGDWTEETVRVAAFRPAARVFADAPEGVASEPPGAEADRTPGEADEAGADDAAPALPPLLLSAPLPPGRASDLRVIEAALTDLQEAWEPDGSEADEALDWSVGVAAGAPVAAPLFRHRASVTSVAPPAAPHGPAAGSTATAGAMGAGRDRPAPASAPSLSEIDDARLRALVTEVLRSELQGELGERITRNVRKLVRREIFRVLETRDED